MNTGVQVRGNATPEELAAVVAVLTQLERGAEPDRYTQWRRTRLAALRRPQQCQRADDGAQNDG
jgi:acyl-CoA carboxylase epsilon subunit-like protein